MLWRLGPEWKRLRHRWMRGRGHDIWRWGRALGFKSIFWYWLHLGQIHFQHMIWEQRAAIACRWDMGGCEEVPSYQLPWSVWLLNRDPDAALDGPNHCILSFDDLAFGSGWDVVMGSWLQEKSVREGMKGGTQGREGWRKKIKSERESRRGGPWWPHPEDRATQVSFRYGYKDLICHSFSDH